MKWPLGWNLCGSMVSVQPQEMNTVFLVDTLGETIPMENEFADLFDSTVMPSLDDVKAAKIVDDSISMEDGHFTARILWKINPVFLPSNRNLAVKRTLSMKNKMMRSEDMRTNVSETMCKFVSQYFEPSSDSDTSLKHYLSWHDVYHPRTGDMRVVWDCAVSLNSFIYETPNIITPLVTVLERFRLFPVACCADISMMYLNVHLVTEDRGAVRILW